jgi:hypothetical protein
MSDEEHPAEAALRFVSLFSEAQEVMAAIVQRYPEMKSPEFGRFVSRRLRRLSDDERVDAMTALASDAGASDQWKATPGVVASLKQIRDTVSHSTGTGFRADSEGRIHMTTMKQGRANRYTADALVIPFINAMWVIEQALYVSSLAGLHSLNGDLYRRESGVTLLDAPPSAKPRQLTGDFVVWNERTARGSTSLVVPPSK